MLPRVVWGCTLLLAVVTLPACAMLGGKSDNNLPVRNAIVYDQLIIHSNFAIPAQHRLFEDLKLLRGEIMERLALSPSDEPIHVYLFDNERPFQTFIRQHYPDFPQRRAFFVKSDTRLAVYAQWGDRMAEDLRHETAHGYLHSVLPQIPLWLDEGLAEYFETPRGAAGLNPPHVQLLMAKLMTQGWRPNIERLEDLQSAGDMTQDEYAESWAWVHWLLESTPERRQLLQRHLAEMRGNPTTSTRLSVAVRQAEPQAEQAMIEHLHRAAKMHGG